MADGDDTVPPPIRLMNFVSEDQLEEARRSRGSRVDDGTAQRDRSLFEILKENKDRKDAEFNDRFKHRPPKALDEDETEFLDRLQMSRREYDQQMADEEAQELRRFQAAVAAHGSVIHEQKEIPSVHRDQDEKSSRRKKFYPHPAGIVIKIKPQAKKTKRDVTSPVETARAPETPDGDKVGSSSFMNASNVGRTGSDPVKTLHFADSGGGGGGLVSYSDGSEEDE